jgi:peptidoglycan/LPS O-acetylase OafA/YrhL
MEVQFYVGWPMLVWALRPATLARLCVALIAVALTVRVGLLMAGHSPEVVYEFPVARMDAVAIGALVALALRHQGGRERVRASWRPVAIVAAAGVGVLVVHGRGLNPYAAPVQTIGYSLLAIGFAALVAGSLLGTERSTHVARLLASRPLVALARHSYAFYLVHFPICFGLMAVLASRAGAVLVSPIPYTAFMLVGMALSYALALACWYAVERPLQTWWAARPSARTVCLPPTAP